MGTHLRVLLSTLAPAAPFAALAQAPPAASPAIEEIVVIAQKREQLIQDVGIAVTAFSGRESARARHRSVRGSLSADPERELAEHRRRRRARRHRPRRRLAELQNQRFADDGVLRRRRLPDVGRVGRVDDVRSRARRGAEGTAGRLVRPQRARRRDSDHLAHAERRRGQQWVRRRSASRSTPARSSRRPRALRSATSLRFASRGATSTAATRRIAA